MKKNHEYLDKEDVLRIINGRISSVLNGFGNEFDSVSELERIYKSVQEMKGIIKPKEKNGKSN